MSSEILSTLSLTKTRWTIAAISLTDLMLGVWNHNVWLVGGGGAGMALVGFWAQKRRISEARQRAEALKSKVEAVVEEAPDNHPPADTAALVEQMLTQGRYCLLLRPQISPNLSHDQLRRGLEALERKTSFVPTGQLCIGLAGKESDDITNDELDFDAAREVVEVDEFRMDRYAVSNRDYYVFVSSGGYSQAP